MESEFFMHIAVISDSASSTQLSAAMLCDYLVRLSTQLRNFFYVLPCRLSGRFVASQVGFCVGRTITTPTLIPKGSAPAAV